MSNGKTIGIAAGALLAASVLFPMGGAGATTNAGAKCSDYTQLTGGGRAYFFTHVTASNVSCKTALVVLEIVPNTAPGRPIEGFSCARHRAAKKLTASCVKKTQTVAFSYRT
jgi:hypothetical protein